VIFLKKSISVVGGDLRIVKLIEMLVKDGYTVYTYGLEQAEELLSMEKVEMCPTVDEVISASEVVIGPIPISKLSCKALIAGTISEEQRKVLEGKNVKYVDVLKREEFTVLNTIATAEGTVQIAMEETPKTVHGSKVLIMGFGRIGKVLAKMLDGIGAKVYCEARKNEDISWIKAYGYEPIHLNNLNEHLGEFDIIINTIPFQILDSERLNLVKKDVVLIDVASNPGGIDRKSAKEKDLKVIWALSLPAKVAPLTSAVYIKETIDHVLKEI
jgi:dipicolinate synthase subunit A